MRLGDWFDLIGGTSTGSIIAAALALGYRAAEVHDFYRQLAPSIFKRSYFRLLGWHAKFDSRNLMRELETIIGARALDSADLITGLCIVLKRMDTGSAWIVMNNPRSAYWTTPADKSFIGNRHLPVANLVRASTAAPSYFDPELIEIAPGQPRGLFIDGGLTPHNNPALMLLMAACLPAYGLNWKLGPDNLLIVSIGTGSFRETLDPAQAMRLSALSLAIHSLGAMISESQQLVLTLMQYLGESPTAWPINSEIGDLGDTRAPTGDLFRFLRYDLRLEEKWLADQLGEDLTGRALERLREMDQPANVPRLYELGRKAAAMQIKREHLEMGAPRAGGEGRVARGSRAARAADEIDERAAIHLAPVPLAHHLEILCPLRERRAGPRRHDTEGMLTHSRRAPAFHGVGDDAADTLLHLRIEKRIVQIVRALRRGIVHEQGRFGTSMPRTGPGKPVLEHCFETAEHRALSRVAGCLRFNRYTGGYVP